MLNMVIDPVYLGEYAVVLSLSSATHCQGLDKGKMHERVTQSSAP